MIRKQHSLIANMRFSGVDRKLNQPHFHKPKPNQEQGPNSMKAEGGEEAVGEKFEARRCWFMTFKKRSHLDNMQV